MKNILLTGGSGFIGRNLREGLAAKFNIYAPRHSELDICNASMLEHYVLDNGIEAVIHAAVHVPRNNGAGHEYENDMLMFENIEALAPRLKKVLYFGSGAEFDKRYDITMVTEDDLGRTVPVSEYGRAKFAMNTRARNSENIYNLRLFGIFGKYELWEIKFLSNLCCKAVFDLPLTVRRDCSFDFLYIEDLTAIVEWFLENKPQYHDYNICMGESYRLSELAHMVREVSCKEMPVEMLSEGRNLDYTASNVRLKAEVNSLQITPMREALENLYRYYLKHKDMIEYEKLAAGR